jgi:hypothetical protein
MDLQFQIGISIAVMANLFYGSILLTFITNPATAFGIRYLDTGPRSDKSYGEVVGLAPPSERQPVAP